MTAQCESWSQVLSCDTMRDWIDDFTFEELSIIGLSLILFVVVYRNKRCENHPDHFFVNDETVDNE